MSEKRTTERILIYRLGSLGDTIVSLPALRLVAHAFPHSERWMLTNFSISEKAAPTMSVLEGTGLVDGYVEYAVGVRDPRKIWRLAKSIRALQPEALIYLTGARQGRAVLRDALFFRACGIKRLIGLPYSDDLRMPRHLGNGLYEYEGARLGRCLEALGTAEFDGPASFDLRLSREEMALADKALERFSRDTPLLAVSIGAKVKVKEWGEENWNRLMKELASRLPGWGLVLIGSADEKSRCARMIECWSGAAANLCGSLSVRTSAAVLKRCRVFIGHDSGPMHLAAAVGTPCVAVFSSRNRPGEWFPYGKQHHVLYRNVECQGCYLSECIEKQSKCIRSISVDEVMQAALEAVGGGAGKRPIQ